MIKSKDFNMEVKLLDDKVKDTPDTVGLADVLKAVLLVGKVLRDVRTNQVIMIPRDKLIKPRPDTARKEEKGSGEKI